jgi:LAS superfamily LD-carboxypeptidase LdcB
MANQFKTFIDEIRKYELSGVNAIEYANGGQEIYISFQVLLKWIGENVNLFSNGEEIIEVDWKSTKPMFIYSTSVSCNLQKCYIRNTHVGTTPGTYNSFTGDIAAFRPITSLNSVVYTQTTVKQEVNGEREMYPMVGNVNYIYLNIAYLSRTLIQESNNAESKTSIRKYLQALCDGVSKALGSINDLQVISDVDGTQEILTIVDYQQTRLKNLIKPTPRTEIKAQGLGSMLTNIQAQSSITPEIADMISIGAQAQGNAVGVEATSFSRLSAGLTDRIYPEKEIGLAEKNRKAEAVELKAKELKSQIESTYREALISYSNIIANQIPKDINDIFSPVSLESTDTFDLENIPVELYKAALAKFTETRQTSTALIPIKLDFTLYGISGIKIFQKFKLSNDILPLSYKGDFEFQVMGVSHELDNSKWNTTINSLISLKEKKPTKEVNVGTFSITLPISIAPLRINVSTGSEISATTLRFSSQVAGSTGNTTAVNGEIPDRLMTELSETLTSKYRGTITSDKGRVRLLTPIMRNLEKMLAAYERDNPDLPLQINSAFRTYNDQVRIRKAAEVRGKPEEAATAGKSNHGLGRAVDFADGNGARLTPSMQQYKWIRANALQYSFKRIEPNIQKGRTEYWEAWHWEDMSSFEESDFFSTAPKALPDFTQFTR